LWSPRAVTIGSTAPVASVTTSTKRSIWLPAVLWWYAIVVLSGDQLPRPAPKSPLLSCLACASLVASIGIAYT